jgi:hypothetical protein
MSTDEIAKLKEEKKEKTKYRCLCGVTLLESSKSKHLASKKHKEALQKAVVNIPYQQDDGEAELNEMVPEITADERREIEKKPSPWKNIPLTIECPSCGFESDNPRDFNHHFKTMQHIGSKYRFST